MKNNWLANLDLNEMEQCVEEYDNLIDILMDLSKNTKYLGVEFLEDCLRDEYMEDIEEMKDILNAEENGEVPSAEEDYKENVIVPTMRGLK